MSDLFAVDVHTHLGAVSTFRPRYRKPEELIALMDRTRTQMALFVPMALLTAQFEIGYRDTCRIVEASPDRLRAYTVYDPHWPDLSLKYIEEFREHPGFVGIKIHPTIHCVDPQDPRYRECWAFANDHGSVVLTHSWSPDPAKPAQNLAVPDRFAEVLEVHPRLRLILGHCGGRDVGRRQAVALIKRFPHCYADISGDDFGQGELEWLLDEAGDDRVLYGTDAVWIEPRYAFAHVLKSGLTPQTKMRIYRNNALALFGAKLAPYAPA